MKALLWSIGMLSLVLLEVGLTAQVEPHKSAPFPVLKGEYLGQRPPGLVPEIFAPGIVSTEESFEYGGVFSPDMKEFYFVRRGQAKNNVLFFTKCENGLWSEPVALPFVGEPSFSPDGKTLYLGNRFVERTATGWSEVKPLGPPFKDKPIMRLTVSSKGTFYFDQMEKNSGISFTRFIDGNREEPKQLGKEINTGSYTAHPFIAPDESYLIWDSEREDGHGSDDLYISFRNKDGSWSKAINMGDEINTNLSEMFASVTPDGKYIFFCRYRDFDRGDVYWVDAKVIENLRPPN